MNLQELALLDNRFISHEARSLYIFEMRPRANTAGHYCADYNRITAVLTVLGRDGRPVFTPDAHRITGYLRELAAVGLITAGSGAASDQPDFHGTDFLLPQALAAGTAPGQTPGRNPFQSGENRLFPMYPEWEPSPAFRLAARRAGLIDPSFDENELAEFVTYWMCRPNMLASVTQWDHRFLARLRQTHGLTADRKEIYRETVGLQRK